MLKQLGTQVVLIGPLARRPDIAIVNAGQEPRLFAGEVADLVVV
jgi:hypothetical protein